MLMIFDSIVYGPIHSRRLGISLGMNLFPTDGKLCTFDCIYCECGYNKDHRPHEKMPCREEVREALARKLDEMRADGKVPDVITFAGNGEPTMHPDFAGIIDDTIAIRNQHCPSAKIAVLSNSTMLGKEVRIGHEPSGKPFLTGGEYHVSISHTKGYVAVGLHESTQPGIDIEAYGERVRKVESRFIREDEMPERARMESREELYQLLLHWSAKETMYKVLDMAEVDFLQHFKVCPFKLSSSGTFTGESYRKADKARFLIHYLIHPEFVCTYCLNTEARRTNNG